MFYDRANEYLGQEKKPNSITKNAEKLSVLQIIWKHEVEDAGEADVSKIVTDNQRYE